jgi:hypothetical protein
VLYQLLISEMPTITAVMSQLVAAITTAASATASATVAAAAAVTSCLCRLMLCGDFKGNTSGRCS